MGSGLRVLVTLAASWISFVYGSRTCYGCCQYGISIFTLWMTYWHLWLFMELLVFSVSYRCCCGYGSLLFERLHFPLHISDPAAIIFTLCVSYCFQFTYAVFFIFCLVTSILYLDNMRCNEQEWRKRKKIGQAKTAFYKTRNFVCNKSLLLEVIKRFLLCYV